MKRNLLVFLILVFSAQLSAAEIAELIITPNEVFPGEEAVVSVVYRFPENMHQTLAGDFFTFTIDSEIAFETGEVIYPEGIIEKGATVYYGTAELKRTVKIPADTGPGFYNLKVTAGYQLCNDAGTCFFPETVEIEGTITVLEGTSAGDKTPFLKIIQFLLMALAGGLLLNIMPCVLPVLSIKALSLVNQSKHDRKKIFTGSILYTAGILLSLLIFAVIIIILKFSGELVGWGFHFQNAGFVISLLTIITVFALSLFDVFTINAPGMNTAAKASGKGGHLGSFLSGIFAVLLATPCTAPFLGTALAFAFSQPPVLIIAIFLMIGLGLALPFIIIGIWPGFIKKIPKPGPWMNTFKVIMGFLLLATALWLIDVLYYQIGWSGLLRVFIFLLVAGFSAAVYGHYSKPSFSRRKQWIALAAAVIIAAAGGFIIFRGGIQTPGGEIEVNDHENWEVFTPEKLEYYRMTERDVFIDFGAKWCWTCKVNEETVLFTSKIAEVFKENDTALLRGDYTNNDKIVGEWIQKFGRAGVPVYAFYRKGAAEPVILPEILTQQMIIDLFTDQ